MKWNEKSIVIAGLDWSLDWIGLDRIPLTLEQKTRMMMVVVIVVVMVAESRTNDQYGV